MGVESGLGGLSTASDILGDDGMTRSGDDVLVSATDSPRSGQSHCLKANLLMAAYSKFCEDILLHFDFLMNSYFYMFIKNILKFLTPKIIIERKH